MCSARMPLNFTHASPKNKLKFCRADLHPGLHPHAPHIPCTDGQTPRHCWQALQLYCFGMKSTAMGWIWVQGYGGVVIQLPSPPIYDSHVAELLLETPELKETKPLSGSWKM